MSGCCSFFPHCSSFFPVCDCRWWRLQLQERTSQALPLLPKPPSQTTRLKDSSELWEWTNCPPHCINVHIIQENDINTNSYRLCETLPICHNWDATVLTKGANQQTSKTYRYMFINRHIQTLAHCLMRRPQIYLCKIYTFLETEWPQPEG